MNCIKCGREISTEHVFCSKCQAEMEKYPVKSGIAIQLPKRRETTVFKKPVSRRRTTQENQVKRLQHIVLVLSTLLLLCALTIGWLIYPLVEPFFREEKPKPGQNYSTLESTGTADKAE